MAGYFLYVSNTESINDAHLCFHHDHNISGKPTINQTINCSVRGRYVIYYNERRQGVPYPDYYSKYAYNEICELEVFGESQFFNSLIFRSFHLLGDRPFVFLTFLGLSTFHVKDLLIAFCFL